MADSRMIAQVMDECRNHFWREYLSGAFSVKNGMLHELGKGLDVGGFRYVIIVGSMQHDGLWQVNQGAEGALLSGAENLADETFIGKVYFCAPPADFVQLCSEIEAFTAKYPVTPYQSESFGAYSYSKAAGAGSADWRGAFGRRLSTWRTGVVSDLERD